MSSTKKPIRYRNDSALKIIGENIRLLRVEKGLTQVDLAIKCGDIDWSQISRMERGLVNFSVSYLILVAQQLEVEPIKLLEMK